MRRGGEGVIMSNNDMVDILGAYDTERCFETIKR